MHKGNGFGVIFNNLFNLYPFRLRMGTIRIKRTKIIYYQSFIVWYHFLVSLPPEIQKENNLLNTNGTNSIYFYCYAVVSENSKYTKPYLIYPVSDIGGTDPDDNQSMTHLFISICFISGRCPLPLSAMDLKLKFWEWLMDKTQESSSGVSPE